MSLTTTLRQAGASRVLEPGDDGYSEAVAGFDTGMPSRPDIVIDAQTAAEVASAVSVAADHRIRVTVLGSGHGLLHPVHEGVAITVRSLTDVHIDPEAQTATIGAGCTWDAVVAAAARYGLAAPCGSAPSVGVTGYLLGGGCGPLLSSIGFSSDHVQSFEVVTPADGPITVSADDHPDMFRAMRGGKSAFGVVTAMVVKLLPRSAKSSAADSSSPLRMLRRCSPPTETGLLTYRRPPRPPSPSSGSPPSLLSPLRSGGDASPL